MRINEMSSHIVYPYQKDTFDEYGTEYVINFLNTECRQALRSSLYTPLFRGSRSAESKMMIVDPSKGTRRSISLGNHYTLLMDNSPYFSNYPKRANSLICSTSQLTAEEYGTPYLVFPVDNTVIGVCPDSDIWESTINAPYLTNRGFVGYDELVRILRALKIPDHDFTAMKNYVSKPEFAEQYKKWTSSPFTGINAPLVDPYMLVERLQHDMRPEVSEFRLTNIAKIGQLHDMERKECWFSAPCVMVDMEYYWKNISSKLDKY